MRNLLLGLIVLIASVSFGQNNYNKIFKDIVEAESKGFANKINSKGAPQSADYDLKYHRLEWTIDPELFYISGAVTTYFEPVVANFNAIYFDLSNVLTVDSVLRNGIHLSYTQPAGNVLKIDFASSLQQNTLDSITVFYQGAPVALSGFGSFVQSSHLNDSIIWTLSEPFGALEWWPCKQDLIDKIDSIDVIVTTPLKNKVGSQGLLVSETTVGSNKIYHWKHRYPIATYLISVAITNYAQFSNNLNLSQGNLEVLNYVYPEDSNSFYSLSSGIIPVMEMFDTLYGPYPFMNEKYGHAQFGWGGGMEHQTMSSMGNFSQHLITHELAHQWFGDKVTCGSWEDIWLNEGFATYSAGLMFRYINPVWWKSWRESVIDNVTAQPDGSVFCTDTTDYTRIFSSRLSYNKGAYLLRMLEWKLGAQDFFAGVRNYLSDNNLAYDFAKTDHLKTHLEAVSGQNLTEFFNDWYYGEGHPTYQVTWSQVGSYVTFTLNQTQSHGSVLFFDMPVPIYAKGQNSDTTFVFDHTFSGKVFNATIPFTIDSIFFDPERWILSSNPTVLSVNEFVENDEITIYPNPSSNKLNIWMSKELEVLEIRLFDALGRNVTSTIIEKSNNFYEIQTEQHASGNYIVEIRLSDRLIRKKWTKL